jgi:tRNA threonylcarbamoyladenosine biosynthesis protein TsaB
MLVLGIDTATWTAVVGLVRDGVVLVEDVYRESHSHTESLPALVERVLQAGGVTLDAVEGLAVSIGPGSFTGLRVSLAFAKGVAFAGGVPLAAVPTLEALAWIADAAPGETICAAIDARKREVYSAFFVADAGGPRRLTEDVAQSPERLASELPKGCVLVGDATDVYGDVLGARATVRPFSTHHPRGGVVARLGWQRLVAGQAVNPGEVEPVYVRAPDAQLPGSR